MITTLLVYAAAIGAACLLFLIAGWHSQRRPEPVHQAEKGAFDWLCDGDGRQPALRDDVAAAVNSALLRVRPLMTNALVRAEIAVPPGLYTCHPCSALVTMLADTLTAAIDAAPASRLLITALACSDRVKIAVIDDMPNADPAYRRAEVRELSEQVIRQGGDLHVFIHPMRGTTISLSLRSSASAVPYREHSSTVSLGS